ncbi:MAG TPA: aspartyl protease family protein [Casimicrobiaceae bacterium]|nr:aspartyl protease family protein [Casimicrobiaceae bacterium]
MQAKRALPISLLAIAGALAIATGIAAAEPPCHLDRIAEWPTRTERNQLLVDGAVNGQPVIVKLDTGATRTIILRPAALKLGLTLHQTRSRLYGVGGEADLELAWVDELAIGEIRRQSWRLLVAGGRDRDEGIAVLLGEDFFEKFDVEFDLAHNAVRLYHPVACSDRSLVYWASGGVSEVEMEAVDGGRPQIVLSVKVNGHSVSALLDSGTQSSLLNLSDAAAAGITPETAGVVPVGKVGGLGRKSVTTWLGTFQSVSIGNEIVRDAALPFADLYKDATYTPRGSFIPRRAETLQPMLLGADFLRAHRVLVLHSQRKIYFTYAGGRVFTWAASARGSSQPKQGP